MATTSPLVLDSPRAAWGVLDTAAPPVGAPSYEIGYVHTVGRPPSPLTSSSRAVFPTGGAQYNRFEAEIVANPAANHLGVINKYAALYGQRSGVTSTDIRDYRAVLVAFAAAYITWLG